MVDDDRRRALLGHELERGRQLHPKLALRRQQLEHRRVILEIGARAIAPRIALAASTGDAELAPQAAVQPLRQRLRRFHGEPVQIERLGVLARRLQLVESARRFIPNRHELQGHDVDVRRVGRAEVIGDAQTLTSLLPREMESRDLPRRSAPRITVRIVDE